PLTLEDELVKTMQTFYWDPKTATLSNAEMEKQLVVFEKQLVEVEKVCGHSFRIRDSISSRREMIAVQKKDGASAGSDHSKIGASSSTSSPSISMGSLESVPVTSKVDLATLSQKLESLILLVTDSDQLKHATEALPWLQDAITI